MHQVSAIKTIPLSELQEPLLAKCQLPNNIAQDYKIGNTRIVIATDDIVSPKEQKAIRERLGEIWYEAEHRSEIEAERTRFEKLFEV